MTRATTEPQRAASRSWIWRYPAVTGVVVDGLVAGALTAAGLVTAADVVIGVVAGAIAVWWMVRFVRAIRTGRWGLDLLAVMAVVSTIAVGEFWAALVIALMMTGGQALEDFASQRAHREIGLMASREPRWAHRVDAHHGLTDVAVDEVAVGDELLIKPGEVVPVDVELLDRFGTVDESGVTGESLPVTRQRGQRLVSGVINGADALRVRAVAAAADSEYQRIVRMVATAAESRSRFVRTADKAAIPFTAVAVVIAAVAWAVSGDAIRFAEVLVVATPCPLLIAAPVAFVAGMGRAARRGVIVKNADVLERIAGLRSVAFDKTGTLTGGKPEVVRVETADPAVDTLEVLSVAAALERSSGHVLAHAVVLAAADRGAPAFEAQEVREAPGSGVTGSSSRGPITVGTAAFAGMPPSPLAAGETAVYVRAGDRPLGRIVLSDPLRQEAVEAVLALRAQGIEQIVMLTGDSRAVAEPVARELGITTEHADLRPLDKARIIRELQPRPVMMVGDGINDAPVLAAADVGVAVASRGATIASETADAVLAVDDLGRLAEAVTIARQTRRIAQQSVWLGVGVSVAVMLVASTGVLPPLIGALVQEGIDLLTIANALRATRSRRG